MHSKGNYEQNNKTAYWIGENICKQHDWLGLNIKNIQAASKTQ